jgi:hypothetical protein
LYLAIQHESQSQTTAQKNLVVDQMDLYLGIYFFFAVYHHLPLANAADHRYADHQ